MGDFSGEWLALREAADFRARSSRLTGIIADLAGRGDAVRALDMGCGTGSNVRYLAERLPPDQDWLLVDHDPVLIAQARGEMLRWAAARAYTASDEPNGVRLQSDRLHCLLRTRSLDVTDLARTDIFDGRTLVTASALLDLVSEPWLRSLTTRCLQHDSIALFALTYDGRMRCSPGEAEDELIRQLVNRHQRSDKGFGAALGPDAAQSAERLFAAAGYQVLREPSDWILELGERRLQEALIDGWAQAANQMAPDRSKSIESWRRRRLAHVAADRSTLKVGHQDIAAWLPRVQAR